MRTVTKVSVQRPAPEVFAVVSDMAQNPDWQRGMKSCTWTSPPPIGVDSTYDQEAGFLGKKIVTSFRVSEFVPDTLIRIVSTKSTFPLDITREVKPSGPDSCEITATVAGEPTGVLKLINPVAKHLVARSVAKDYQRLKQMLES